MLLDAVNALIDETCCMTEIALFFCIMYRNGNIESIKKREFVNKNLPGAELLSQQF